MSDNWEHPRNTNSRTRFQKPFGNGPRNLNFWRRPSFPSSRRRSMAGRYPNMGFRHCSNTKFRQDCPTWHKTSPGPRYCTSYSSTSSFNKRPFPRMPRNTFDNRNCQHALSTTNINERHSDTKLNEYNSDPNTFSDLWVEALAPGGRLYYYNTRTRESTWVKPVNVRIIELNEIKQLPIHPETEKPENIRNENSNPNAQQQQPIDNSYFKPYDPRTVLVQPQRVIFPPNVFSPPPNFLGPPAESTQNGVANYNVRFIVPPPLYPVSFVSHNVLPNSTMNEYNVSVTQDLLPSHDIQCNPGVVQDYLPENDIKNIIDNGQNVFPGTEIYNINASNDQSLLSSNEVIVYHQTPTQDALPSNKVDNCTATATQNVFALRKVIDYSSSDSDETEIGVSVVKNKEIEHIKNKNENANSPESITIFTSSSTLDMDTNNKVKCVKNKNVTMNTPESNTLFPSSNTLDMNFMSHKEVKRVKEKNENMNTQECDMRPLSNTLDMDISKHAKENNMKHVSEKSADLESQTCVTQSMESEDSVMTQTECISSTSLLSKDKPNNKSRPVSSTPVPGTYWFVVWTGDERVFFYDSKHIVSVWERPTELLNRSDVDKMLIASPVLLNLKPLTKEARKNSSDLSDVIKKQKKDDEKCENSEMKTAVENASIENVIVDEKNSEIEQKPQLDSNSHEQKPKFDSHSLDQKPKLDSCSNDQKPKLDFHSNHQNTKSDSNSREKKPKLDSNSHEQRPKSDSNSHEQKPKLNSNFHEQKPKLHFSSHEEKVKIFYEMLAEKKVATFSTWEKEVHKIVFDSRYLLLDVEERKQVFNSYMKAESQEEVIKRQSYQMQKQSFISMLVEAGVNSESLFSDIALNYCEDKRFKAIEELEEKRNIFNRYISELKQKNRECQKLQNTLKRDFFQLLSEKNCFNKEWLEVRQNLMDDERYKAIRNDCLKENLFKEFVQKARLKNSIVEKQKLTETNEKKHEKVTIVDRKNRDKKQQKLKHTLAALNFKSLLEDFIDDLDTSWQSAQNVLKEDQRWSYSRDLGIENCEKLFNDYITDKKKYQFRQLLDEIPDMTMKTSWLDIRNVVLKDPRCGRFDSCERKCEKEFKEYLNSKRSHAKEEFRQLLKETKMITHKSKSLLASSKHLQAIEKVLSQDKRYTNLDCLSSERKQILLSYIGSLHGNKSARPSSKEKLLK